MPPKNRTNDDPADEQLKDGKDAKAEPAEESDEVKALREQLAAAQAERDAALAKLEVAEPSEPDVPASRQPAGEPCEDCFPNGWDSENITRAEEHTGVPQNRVTCEHGTYRR